MKTRDPHRRIVMAAVLVLTLLAFPGFNAEAFPAGQSVRAVVFGDFNGPYGSTTYSPVAARVINRIITEWRPDIVLSAGDLVAGQKRDLPDTRFPLMWRAFDAVVGRPLRQARIPFGFTLGNHDASAARDAGGGFRFGRERDHAAVYWRDPAQRPPLDYRDASHFPFYYSFMLKGIFVVVLDASTHVIQDAPWVVAALQSAHAAAARLQIVMGHLPLYGISEGRSKFGEVVEGGEQWRRRFEALGVDLYISGHHAAYYPARRGRLRFLHSGGGVGARPYVGYPRLRPRSTVTLMDIDLRARMFVVETFDAETGARIPLNELPPCINGYNGPVFRIDVPQKARCESRR